METDNKIEFVFVDIETTGLDHTNDAILEVGIVATDINLRILHSKSWLVGEVGWYEKLKAGIPLVQEMHEKSGLVREIRDYAGVRGTLGSCIGTSMMIETWVMNLEGFKPGIFPMAGSTVQFDRAFLEEQMPRVADLFTYRNIDVSSIKELAKRWAPRLAEHISQDVCNKKNAVHRVLPDIDNSIAELMAYVEGDFIHAWPI